MASTNSLVVLYIYCCATADILTKLLQQCFLFFIVVVIPGHNLGNSQVSVNRTIGPTLVFHFTDPTQFILKIEIKIKEIFFSILLAHLSRRLIGELIVYEGIRRLSSLHLSTSPLKT